MLHLSERGRTLMYQNLKIFQTASAMAKHAGAQQTVIAQNIANADTPGYKARKMASFSETMSRGSEGANITTRPRHLSNQSNLSFSQRLQLSDSEPAPNGNSVSIEEETMASVAVAREHTRALAIYRHGMTVLRTVLGR